MPAKKSFDVIRAEKKVARLTKELKTAKERVRQVKEKEKKQLAKTKKASGTQPKVRKATKAKNPAAAKRKSIWL